MTQRKGKPPYAPGDAFTALCWIRGTCLAEFETVQCTPAERGGDGRQQWQLTGRSGEDVRCFLVNGDGHDRSGYVRPGRLQEL